MDAQAGILETVPSLGTHLTFALRFAANPRRAIRRLADEAPASCVIRLGLSLIGLYFLAFGESLDRFERVLQRMVGCEDGIVDGLFAFTRPVTGGYFWCPPQRNGRIVLSAVGL